MQLFTLGDEAIEYLRNELVLGNALARELTKLRLEQGKVRTFLPSSTSHLALTTWNAGGVVLSSEPTELFCSAVYRFLQSRPNRVYLFEDRCLRTTHPAMATLTLEEKYVTVNSEVFYFFDSTDTEKVIVEAMRGRPSACYLFVGALCEGDGKTKLVRGDQHEQAVLQEYATEAKHVVVTAYDDEAFLVWSGTDGEGLYAESDMS